MSYLTVTLEDLSHIFPKSSNKSMCWYLCPQYWTFVQARRCQKSGCCKDFKEKTKPRLAFECWPRLVEEILDQSVRGCFLSSLKLRTNIVSRPRQVTHPPHSTVRAQLKQHSQAICTQHSTQGKFSLWGGRVKSCRAHSIGLEKAARQSFTSRTYVHLWPSPVSLYSSLCWQAR